MGEIVVQIRDIEHFHWQLSESECPISFSSNGGGISLAAAVELVLIAAHRRADSSEPHAKIRVARSSIWALVKESRWPLRSGCAVLRDGDAAVLILPTAAADPWWIQRISTLLADLTANGFPSHLARGITGADIEMVDNVWLHSEALHPGLLAYQIRRRKFAFSVIDAGVGVLASLRKNPALRYLSIPRMKRHNRLYRVDAANWQAFADDSRIAPSPSEWLPRRPYPATPLPFSWSLVPQGAPPRD